MGDVSFLILKIVVSICAMLITIYAVPYLHELQKDARYSQLFELIEAAVRAAEQTIRGVGMGTVKKEHVMNLIKGIAAEHHITVTDEQLSEIVEAAVYQMKLEAK